MSIGKNSLKRVQSAAQEKETASASFIVSTAPDMESSEVLTEKPKAKKPATKKAPAKKSAPTTVAPKKAAKKQETNSYPIGSEMPVYLL